MERIVRLALVFSALLVGMLLVMLILVELPAMAATKDTVLINEVLASHEGLDNTEYIELFGIPGTPLDGLSLIVVDGDLRGEPGAVIDRLDFGPMDVLGTNGFYLVGTAEGLVANYGVVPNVEVPQFYLKNGSQTVALVKTRSIGGDFVTRHEVVMDAVALRDGTLGSVFYFRAPVIGHLHEDLPAGARRVADGVNTGAAADWVASDFHLGAANTPTAGDAPPVWTVPGDPAFIGQLSALAPMPIPTNEPPVLSADRLVVTVDEGDQATNSGSAVDLDGLVERLVPSLGDITLDGNTWSWLYRPADTSDDRQVGIRATDDSGATGLGRFEPDDVNVAPVVGPIAGLPALVYVGAPIAITALFTDPSAVDIHAAFIGWGDGSSCNTDVGPDCSLDEGTGGVGIVAGSHVYTEPGIYTVQLTVTDDDGGTDTSLSEPVVVYDPEGSFVTGGGWIDSPPGAYAPDPSLTGRANFGFVAKYKKGRSVPDGTTEFVFRTADLNFHSSSYDWLVVTGSNYARFKGSGTINGSSAPNGEDYKFMLRAGDGTGSNGQDTFRIKIWWGEAEYLVYDNGGNQGIGGGSIVIH